MCLISKHKPKKTTKNIVCYKFVMQDPLGNYVPLYQDGQYDQWPRMIGKRKTNILHWIFNPYNKSEGMYHYKDGFIHANTCLNFIKTICTYRAVKIPAGYKLLVCKCVIPKGTPYAKDDVSYGSICATEMFACETASQIHNNTWNKL